MDTKLMDFLNNNTNYNFGYIKTDLYINKEGKLESIFNHIGESDISIYHGRRQKELLYGVENSKNKYITHTITIVERSNNNYDLLELGVLKLENATEEDVKKHVVYKSYVNEHGQSKSLGYLPDYEDLLN